MAHLDGIQDVDIDVLIPYINNAKQHNEEQVAKIAGSIREFGFVNPVLIDKDYNIIAGHGRVMAARKLGKEKVPCAFVEGLTEAQRKAYILADNRLGELADWDMDMVAGELEELLDMDFDIDLTGFELPEEYSETDVVEDDVPEEVETRCKRGDLWKLGEHRLVCGDSTDHAIIDRLMGGASADMVFTDPPYNVAMSRSKVDGSDNSIKNDNLSNDDYIELLQGAFTNALHHCKSHNMYWWIGFRQYSTLERIFKDNNIKIANCIVWDKGSIGLGGDGYRYQHELCIFSGKTNNNSSSDVWKFDRSTEGIHPTMKPVALVAHAIQNISDAKRILDMFGGSGSTLVACEQLNKKCYMCELDEHYCDVIIQRWENFTDQKAVLLDE